MLYSFRDDALRQVDSLKRQNDGLLVNTVSLEQKLQKERERIFGSEEQLRKLEQKISISDINLATQVKLRTFPPSLASLSRKRSLSRQILINDVIWSIITFAFIYLLFLSYQDEDLIRRERELKDIQSKLEQATHELGSLKRQELNASGELRRYREKEREWEGERKRLQVGFLFQKCP